MPNVKIIADSTCDLGDALIAQHDISIAPLCVTIDGKTYRDGVDITASELLAYSERTKQIPKTAATPLGDLYDLFKSYTDQGRDIVFIGISSQMSTELQNAALAAAEPVFDGRTIRCVDSQNLSSGIGLLVLEAACRARQGMDANQIAVEIEALRGKVSASFVLDTLTYLHRGGRCSGLQALGAAILNIKPQISVIDGAMAPTDKFRGNISRVALRYVDKMLTDIDRIDPKHVFVTHASFPDEALRACLENVEGRGYFQNIYAPSAGSVISSHCGPKTMGILFIEK